MTSEEWDKLVRSCDTSTVYQLHEWGTLLKELLGHQLVYLQEDGGVFPLALVRSPIFKNRLISLPFADYGGPCTHSKETADNLVRICQEAAQELHADFIEVRCPDSQYFEILSQQGFVRRDDYLTFSLRLNGNTEQSWSKLGERKKKQVRKAERSGVETFEAAGKPDLKTFHLLYQNTMKKLGSPPQSYSFFDRMWDLFYPQNMKVFLARLGDKYIAGKLFLLHNNTIYQAYKASLGEYLNLRPNDLLQWHLIKWGNEHRFKYIDFGRTRKKDEGTILFKKQWGGEPVDMPYFYKFYGTELRERQEIQYHWLSTLWSKYMPGFVANRVGPWLIRQIG